jgi:hypothetical protein
MPPFKVAGRRTENSKMAPLMNIDRVVERTATRISAAMDKMVADLPETAVPQMAIELVIRRLAVSQPWLMQLTMEDKDIREAYAAAVAEQPATPGSDDQLD